MEFIEMLSWLKPSNWKFSPESKVLDNSLDEPEKNAAFGIPSISGNQIYTQSYDGVKNLGEAGPIINYIPEYYSLNFRSWQAYTSNELAKTVLNKYSKWIIGEGLNLKVNPNKKVLEIEGIDIKSEEFNNSIEALFSIWAKSTHSAHNGMDSLNVIAETAYINSKIGGDVLVILRFIDGTLKIQLIDGANVCSPIGYILPNGNIIRNGVEKDPTGKHVAYHVLTRFKYERIEAYNPDGFKVAYLVYGSKHRMDYDRGLPLISASIETLSKLDRYKEAAVGSAEERQKIVYAIEHEAFSTGENPFADNLARQIRGSENQKVPVDATGETMRDKVQVSTNKTTVNMNPGSKLTSLESRNEMFFKEFYETNADIYCAAVGIPSNVAFSIYTNSYSASRAATKDWDHTILINRANFSFQFYQPIYNLFLHTMILMNKIQAPGYLVAFSKKNWFVLESYRTVRFTGPMFPHIDPVKEVTAERLKLGKSGENMPLSTLENATEALGEGDSNSNMEQYAKELEKLNELEINVSNDAVVAVPTE